MKILIPYADMYDHPIDHEMVTGGVELFCRHILNNFDAEVYQIPYRLLGTKNLKEKYQATYDIIQRANEIGADLIVSNFNGAIFSGAKMAESNIPVMVVEHILYPYLSPVQRWVKMREYGHSVFHVSEFQTNWYSNLSKRLLDDPETPLPVIDGRVSPSFLDGEPPKIVENPEYDIVTIGRCNPYKDPFRLHTLTEGLGYKTLIMTTNLINEADAYCEKFTSKINDDNIAWNLPHREVMKNLSNAATYMSTCPNETWGVTALEALSYGIPLLLVTTPGQGHASESIAASTHHYRHINKKSKSKVSVSYNNLKALDRKEIQQRTYEKHSKEAWKRNMANAFDKTVERFKKANNTLRFTE